MNEKYQEFVVYDENGKEIDWVSPVISIKTTNKIYVYNGISTYEFPLNTKYKIVEREE